MWTSTPRMTLDALDDGDVYTDDSRFVMVLSANVWAEEPGCERPAVFVTKAIPSAARGVLAAMVAEVPRVHFEERASCPVLHWVSQGAGRT